ncbi:hydroxymethylbilane synthase [Candidatus Hecatella orcuttiae]|jgi:hydroxymethylbilane synthase|uniref:hydroxymethylbilane synthase n=1 Tax=Candidatus Hecatella orcuttiae TaxID=1935119 RepID=UPI002867D0AF|nr:hydroxymethylbilane synthase [Candidatus Hecatella orcuttiae]
MKLIVGTRGSKLSLIQTDSVVQKLTEALPDLKVETKVIKTTGDKFSRRPLLAIKEKGIFEKEIDMAVLRGEADFAVHSLKDVPTELPQGLTLAAVPERESPYDVLVSRGNLGLENLPPGAVVGTGSPRRSAQLHALRPDLQVKPIRGNVDTRVRKVKQGLFDAVILAEAGLRRLSMGSLATKRLPPDRFTPAPGQGALAVVSREDDGEVLKILSRVDHSPSRAEVLAERVFVREMGGGCKVPLGALACVQGRRLLLHAAVFSPDGKICLQTWEVGSVKSPEEAGVKLARRMRRQGAGELIQHWRALYEKR